MESAEFVIVGGGVMGAAAAWALRRGGARDVVLLERFGREHDRGSSHGPTRIFRYAYEDPFYVRLAQQTLPLWRQVEAETATTLLHTTGGIDVGRRSSLDSSASALRACGAVAEMLGPREVRDRFPGFSLGDGEALWSPDTAVIAASRAVEALRVASSADVRFGVTATGFADEGSSVVVSTDRDPIRARRVIVTAGPWNGPLLAGAGIDLPLRVTREQVFYFRGGKDLPVLIERAEFFRYMLPPAFGAPGAKVGEHVGGETTTAEGRSDAIDPEGEARVCDWVAGAMPALEAEPVAADTCLYTMTPDEDFVLGARGPIVFASPCSGHGFKFAPLIGEILAAVAQKRDPPVDPSRFSASRFAGR